MIRRALYIVLPVCLMALLVLGGIWYTNEREPSYVVNGSISIPEAIEYWSSTIKSIGPQDAYAKMVSQGLEIPAQERHILAHTFGEALYSNGDLNDIVHCGKGEFLYGCHHQFIGFATAEHGVSVLRVLKDICDGTRGDQISCAHAIGHGLVSAYGYDLELLPRALGHCRTYYTTESEQGICADGAFMEYNLTEIEALDRSNIRTFSEKAAYSPCVEISPNFDDECVYELPLWWYQSLSVGPTTEAVHAEVGTLCRNLPLRDARGVCFAALGFPIAQFNQFDIRKIADACSHASESREENVLCVSGAARRYFENGLAYEQACKDLTIDASDDENFCIAYVTSTREDEYAMARTMKLSL